MDQHLYHVVKGAAVFTGIYLVLKASQRYGQELDFPSKDRSLASKVCTWAMGAVGTGLSFAALASISRE